PACQASSPSCALSCFWPRRSSRWTSGAYSSIRGGYTTDCSSLPFFRYSARGVWNCYGRRIPLRSPRVSRCGMPSRSLTDAAPRTSSILANQIENHDLDTFRHVDRVAAFAYLIGHDVAFGSSRLRRLVLAGQMHDIGKIGLPPYILTKPGKLTDEEWAASSCTPPRAGKSSGGPRPSRTLQASSAII